MMLEERGKMLAFQYKNIWFIAPKPTVIISVMSVGRTAPS